MGERESLEYILQSLQEEIEGIKESYVLVGDYGHITTCINHGTKKLVETKYVKGSRTRHFYKLNEDYAKAAITKVFLEKLFIAKSSNYELIKSIIPKLCDGRTTRITSKMQEELSLLDIAEIESSIECVLSRQDEKDQEFFSRYKPASFKESEKVHMTSKGLRMRSKSEVLIAERLYMYNIQFIYEPELRISGKVYAPDFVIRNKKGKDIYWEHFGLTGDSRYINSQFYKVKDYIYNGITPWDNLIITYDDPEGNIDLRIIDSEIKNKLLG